MTRLPLDRTCNKDFSYVSVQTQDIILYSNTFHKIEMHLYRADDITDTLCHLSFLQ